MPGIIDSFTGRLLELLKSDDIRDQLVSTVSDMLTPETLVQIFENSGTIEFRSKLTARAEYLGSLISERVLSLAAGAVPAVLKKLDIRKIVTDKIDSLEMEEVEGLVFGIMKSQFKWINIFGGILGGLIGILQSILSLLF
ncbi:MAG: DUF445 family protein [Spirochaetaceae bacterium]|jgi:uncharacterized membrane protein YheB (UPF0754 family)|nr:DUF445 family protein [Spirochaetaceae bacterium]